MPLLPNDIFNINMVTRFLTRDQWCRKENQGLYSFVAATLSAILFFFIFLVFGDPPKESVTEILSEFLLFIAACIFFYSSFMDNRAPLSEEKKIFISKYAFFAGLFLLFVFGEEISWGLRIFDLDVAAIFREFNYQDETNVHNFFNPQFAIFYPMLGMGSFLFFCLGWFFDGENNSNLYYLLFPHSSLFLISFIMACSSTEAQNELFEILFAIFALLYAIRLMMCLRYPLHKAYLENGSK